MIFLEKKSLKLYNTFGIESYADFFVSVHNLDELKQALFFRKEKSLDLLVLGGGSNILFTQDLKGLVVHLDLKGKQLLSESNGKVQVKIEAGENWHEFVLWSIAQGYGGIENLSLIPGNVGTAPMQNIGAYGREIKDVLVSLEAMEVSTQEIKTFSHADCQFDYRESIFKKAHKGKYILLNATFELTSENHKYTVSYGAIEAELRGKGLPELSPKVISEAIISIRLSKLPDPTKIGNAGSFFKNPVVENEQYLRIKKDHPKVVAYALGEKFTKLAAGWLIESAGWKGKPLGNAKVHAQQALVLINNAKETGVNVTGKEIWDLSEAIIQDVQNIFSVRLEREVNIH